MNHGGIEELTTSIYVDSTATVSLTFTDDVGAAVDPTAIALVIKDSAGATKATKAIGDLTNTAVGAYHYHHNTASTDMVGVWRAEVTATIAALDEVTVTEFYVRPLDGATAYFDVTPLMVKRKYKDTDSTDDEIWLEAQQQEYKVMRMVGLTAAPGDAIELANLQLATALLTAAELEGNEPHSRAEGGYREDKFSQVMWRQEAKELIDQYRKAKYVKSTSFRTDKIDSAWA